jgi:ceramide glucosyltransferase
MALFQGVLILVAALGIAQGIFGLAVVRGFARRAPRVPAEYPPVTILKPVCGPEPLLEEALVSFCRQNYPRFQLVIGAQDFSDPALAAARRVKSWYPELDIRIVIDPIQHGANGKISNLMNMLPHAAHDILVIADSDLHVAPDYLHAVVGELLSGGTGLVTTLPTGKPAAPGLAAKLGATHLTHCFLPSALIGEALGRQDCLGGTMALRRQTLEQVGGLAALVDHLADDNVLGQAVKQLGLAVRLANTFPAVTVQERDMRALWQHELRWARTIASVAPLSQAGCVIQYPIFWGLLAVLASGGAPWGFGCFAAAWAARAAIVVMIERCMAPRRAQKFLGPSLWLLPLRDVLTVAEIVAGFCGRRVEWRGRTLYAERVVRAPPFLPVPAISAGLPENFAGETESIVIG